MAVKRCLIPGCDTTEESGKLFISVPRDRERRKRWCEVVKAPITAYHAYCCEDHFVLQEDAENWLWFRIAGNRLRLKPDVVPHVNLSVPSQVRKRHESQFSNSSKMMKKLFLDSLDAKEEVLYPSQGGDSEKRKQRFGEDFNHASFFSDSSPEPVICLVDPVAYLPALVSFFQRPTDESCGHQTNHDGSNSMLDEDNSIRIRNSIRGIDDG